MTPRETTREGIRTPERGRTRTGLNDGIRPREDRGDGLIVSRGLEVNRTTTRQGQGTRAGDIPADREEVVRVRGRQRRSRINL